MQETQYKLLSVKQTAQELGVSRETVRRWIHKGVLRAVRIGRNHKIPEAQLQKLIRRQGELTP
ncbi:MAG: helix-turn-helix domain-containing protein [Firmicutes bacterium]|nr:helix-turn-helix domain-containing protein [Bacillota bacterium]